MKTQTDVSVGNAHVRFLHEVFEEARIVCILRNYYIS